MTDRTTQLILERIDILAAQVLSLIGRADVMERVARELRTEAACATHDLTELRKNLQSDILRQKIRREYSRREAAPALRRRSA